VNDDESDAVDGMQQKMTDAICNAVAGDGDFVTKFVCLVEVIDTDGDSCLWAVASKNISSWETLGMLTWALQHEQAGKVIRVIGEAAMEGDDDDE
jgi:hypothetical protein